MEPHDPTGAGMPSSDEAWLTVSDGLLAGVHHALNNRMAALTAVAQVLESDLPRDHPLASALSGEAERLERTVSLLRALPRGRGAPEPVQLGDVLRTVVQLFGMHHAVRDVSCEVVEEPGILPLWIEPATLTHALLVLTTVAGWHARGLRDGKVVVRCAGGADLVTVTVQTQGEVEDGAAREDDPDGPLGRIDVRAVAEMLAAAGGEVEGGKEPGGGWRATARLLTLPEARRREAASQAS